MKAKKFERSSYIRKFRFILLQVRLCRKTFNSTGIESNKDKPFSREKIVWHVRTCRHQKISHATKIKTQKSRREKEREKRTARLSISWWMFAGKNDNVLMIQWANKRCFYMYPLRCISSPCPLGCTNHVPSRCFKVILSFLVRCSVYRKLLHRQM